DPAHLQLRQPEPREPVPGRLLCQRAGRASGEVPALEERRRARRGGLQERHPREKSMTRFLLRRALWFVFTVWVVVSVSFVLMRAVRGGPFSSERALHPAVERSLQARYHLDWPLWKQYLQYVGPVNLGAHGPRWLGGDGSAPWSGILSLDLGPSFKYRDYTVNDILAQSLPISAALGALALAWALLFGLASGILSAVRPGSALDLGVRLLATLG